MDLKSNHDVSAATAAFGSSQAIPKTTKNRPYLLYKILFSLMLLPPVLLIAFFLFVGLIEGRDAASSFNNSETTLILLLMIPTTALMIIWNFSVIPFFFYSALVLSKASKPRVSVGTIIMCIMAMLAIPAVYLFSFSNMDTSSDAVKDLIFAPYVFTTNLLD